MGKINAKWHMKNKMPKNPKIEEKVKWHREHLLNCTCRTDIPESLRDHFK